MTLLYNGKPVEFKDCQGTVLKIGDKIAYKKRGRYRAPMIVTEVVDIRIGYRRDWNYQTEKYEVQEVYPYLWVKNVNHSENCHKWWPKVVCLKIPEYVVKLG